ncbi:hypothetical protein BT63DRAFT_482751 [Microthyrium microscopicum]|uniref:Uncharacterized protein n=1 Tax=Microthyrium microscopicum TaxID=703497 RepID=A0A6A6TYQ4_9PEZI|nr:hypothetical protein BT63DRAFT_482751 [Microthyrium microscopicum]
MVIPFTQGNIHGTAGHEFDYAQATQLASSIAQYEASELPSVVSTVNPNPTDLPTIALPPKPSSTPAGPKGKDVLVVWDQPPVTGPYSYRFYVATAGSNPSVVDPKTCDGGPGPWIVANDAVSGRADKARSSKHPLGPGDRKPVGIIDLKSGNSGDKLPQTCGFNDLDNGKASIYCPGPNGATGKNYPCIVPDSDTYQKITPDSGKCPKMATMDEIDNVKMLAYICNLPDW